MARHRLCVVLAGGSGAPATALPDPDFVIAADSGVGSAAALGLHVDLVVGDFDSALESDVARVVAAGAELERHPTDKDATDLELALDAAGRHGATRTIVVGGGGTDRIDHVLVNGAVITADRFAAIGPEWWVGGAVAYPTRRGRIVSGGVGDIVSIIPMGGAVRVTTEGLRWELHDEVLPAGSSRGISNELVGSSALVDVHAGIALVVHVKGSP